MKQQMWKDKIEYIWMYFKIPIICGFIFVIVVSYILFAKLTEKQIVLNAIMFDMDYLSAEQMIDDFISDVGLDRRKEEVIIMTNYKISETSVANYAMGSIAKLYAEIGTQGLDVVVMSEMDYREYVDIGMYMNLEDVFSREELKNFSNLYQTEDGKIWGIYLESFSQFSHLDGEKKILGVVYNTKNLGMSKQFIQFLSKE